MSAVPIARFLVDLGPPRPMAAEEGAPLPWLPAPAWPSQAQEKPEDPAARLREEFERGRAEGEAAAHLAHAVWQAAERKRYDERLAEERRQWTQQEGERLAARLDAAMMALEQRMSDSVSRVLAHFLTVELRRRAVADLADRIRAIATEHDGISLEVHGPADLIEPLRDGLGSRFAASFVADARVDVRVVAGDTRIETHLAAWISKLEEMAA